MERIKSLSSVQSAIITAGIVLAVVALIYFVSTKPEIDNLNAENQTQVSAINSLSMDLAASKGELETTQGELANAIEREAIAKDVQEKQAATIFSLETTITDLETEIEEFLLCADAGEFSPNYSSNSAMSASIKRWLENTQSSIRDATWDVVWSNSQVTRHNLTGEFLYVYIAYFDDPQMDYKNGLFDVGFQCWLDGPN